MLKPGGVFIWDICAKDLSYFPPFNEILEKTPGASSCFQYFPSILFEDEGFVVCRKPADGDIVDGDRFMGFPFEVLEELKIEGADVGSFMSFFRNAVYRKVGEKL